MNEQATTTAYALRMIQRIFFGENREGWEVPDSSLREMGVMALMMVPLLWLGLSPQPLIDRVGKGNPSVADQSFASSPHLPGKAWRPGGESGVPPSPAAPYNHCRTWCSP